MDFASYNLFLPVIIFGAVFVLGSCGPGRKKAEKRTKQTTHKQAAEMAPDFSALDEDGNRRTLAEFRGQKVALYFYPKSGTPGCTKQACSLRDGFSELQEAGITVIGITYDKPATLKSFKTRKHLPFVLLSDSNKKIAKAYGAHGGMFGFIVPRRITYLIDEQGRLVGSIKDIDVAHHARQIIDAFA